MEKSRVISYAGGLLSALLASVILVFIFAIVISYLPISSDFIRPINAVIKAIAVLLGGFIALRGDRGAIKGVIFGTVYFVLSYLLFSAISGAFEMSFRLIIDLVICALVGGIVGVIKVNAR
ncbi:MAG: TIGR04086 family membrane protein [Clostridia bacterium]|nr:TIGR04086 family membrane protein [Clostridia bacterium]